MLHRERLEVAMHLSRKRLDVSKRAGLQDIRQVSAKLSKPEGSNGLDYPIKDAQRRRVGQQRATKSDIMAVLPDILADNPDVNIALVLTAIVIAIERIGDYTKNIVELAVSFEQVFEGGEIEADLREVESILTGMFDNLIPGLQDSDEDLAREIIAQHEKLSEIVERNLEGLSRGKLLDQDSIL